MIRRLNLNSWASIAALLLAPVPAAAQEAAPSGASDDEIFCISNGMVESAPHGGLDDAGARALVSQCRQRFGWSEMETRAATLAGQVTVRMQLALADADNAGVQRSVINDVIRTFDSQAIQNMQIRNLDPDAGYPEMTRQATARLAQRGVTGEAAATATRAVIWALIAIRVTANVRAALRNRAAH
jgi:hypothetical protein